MAHAPKRKGSRATVVMLSARISRDGFSLGGLKHGVLRYSVLTSTLGSYSERHDPDQSCRGPADIATARIVDRRPYRSINASAGRMRARPHPPTLPQEGLRGGSIT